MALYGVLRNYIGFRVWCNDLLADAGLVAAIDSTGESGARRNGQISRKAPEASSRVETEMRLANLEREIAELRAATAALDQQQQRHTSQPRLAEADRSTPRRAVATPSSRIAARTPRTVPRPRAVAGGSGAVIGDDGTALGSKQFREVVTQSSVPASAQAAAARTRATIGTPAAGKLVEDLTCDEVAVSLLLRFA